MSGRLFPLRELAIESHLGGPEIEIENDLGYALFNTLLVQGTSMQFIDRVVIGRDRARVAEWHADNPEPPPQAEFSNSSDAGFGRVVVLRRDGQPSQDIRDILILPADMQAFRGEMEATRLVLASEMDEFPENDRQLFSDRIDAVRLQTGGAPLPLDRLNE